MAETPEPSAATGLPPVPHDRGALPPGTIINNTYEIEERISAGGMGEVYRACHRERRQSKVAIKVMLPSLEQDEQMIALFKAEAEALERTRHEAVVGYRGDFLDPALGRRVLVMEFVAGEPLSRRMRTAPLTEDECLSLLRRVATGLALAHDEGVVHRDLKPANIILEKGKVSRAKLIDFGIAKMTRMDGEGSVIGSRVAGTYTFMSPEHLGMYGKVDRRSDIYSLALVVAAAARGSALPMGESPFECIECRKVVPDLSEIGPRLRPVLAAMLAPRPEERPQDMVAVLDLVEAAIAEGAAAPAPAAPARPGGDDAGSGVAPPAQRDTGGAAQTPAPASAPPRAPPAPPQADPGSLAPTSLSPASLAPTSIAPAALAPTSRAPASAVHPADPGQPSSRPSVPPGAADPASLAPTSISPASAPPASLAPTSIAPPVTRDTPSRPDPLAEAPPTVVSAPPVADRAGPPSTPGPVVTGVPDWSPPPEPASVPESASRPGKGAGAASAGGKPASRAPLLIVAGLALAGVLGGVALIGLPGGREPAPPTPADTVPQITDIRPPPQPPVAPAVPEAPADTAAAPQPDAEAPPGPAVAEAEPAPDAPSDSRLAALGPETAPPPDPVQPTERQAEPAPDPAVQPPAPADPAPPAPEPPAPEPPAAEPRPVPMPRAPADFPGATVVVAGTGAVPAGAAAEAERAAFLAAFDAGACTLLAAGMTDRRQIVIDGFASDGAATALRQTLLPAYAARFGGGEWPGLRIATVAEGQCPALEWLRGFRATASPLSPAPRIIADSSGALPDAWLRGMIENAPLDRLHLLAVNDAGRAYVLRVTGGGPDRAAFAELAGTVTAGRPQRVMIIAIARAVSRAGMPSLPPNNPVLRMLDLVVRGDLPGGAAGVAVIDIR